jgi:hypothetical protein
LTISVAAGIELALLYCMDKALAVEVVRTKYLQLHPLMTERLRRQWAACEAESLGRGGTSLVAQATGLSRHPIRSGRRELQRRADQPQDDLAPDRVRAPGGGRHRVEQDDATIVTDLGEGQGEFYLPLASGLMVMSYLGRVLDRSRRVS